MLANEPRGCGATWACPGTRATGWRSSLGRNRALPAAAAAWPISLRGAHMPASHSQQTALCNCSSGTSVVATFRKAPAEAVRTAFEVSMPIAGAGRCKPERSSSTGAAEPLGTEEASWTASKMQANTSQACCPVPNSRCWWSQSSSDAVCRLSGTSMSTCQCAAYMESPSDVGWLAGAHAETDGLTAEPSCTTLTCKPLIRRAVAERAVSWKSKAKQGPALASEADAD